MLLERISGLEVERIPPSDKNLRNEWHRLWYRSARSTIFQSPEWLLAWNDCFGSDDAAWILTFRDEERLVGVAPLQRWCPNRRRMIFLGTGLTDSLDIVAETVAGRLVATALFEFLHLHENEWDICDLEHLPGISPVVMEPAPVQWHSALTMQDVSPVLTLPEPHEQLARIRELTLLKKRLERHGRVKFAVADASSFDRDFETLLSLQSERWGERKLPGPPDSVRSFHRMVAQSMLELGALRLYTLQLDGKPIGSYYGFHHRGRATYYLSSIDPQWASYRLETLLVGFAIERAINERAVEFDFQRGNERYKYRWGARDRFNYRRTMEH